MATIFFLVCVLSCLYLTKALTTSSDVAALAAFKAAISPSSINKWSCLASWDFSSSSDPCRPANSNHFICGLSCSADSSRITAVTLDPAGYSGELSPAISNLTALIHLDITDNNFFGNIPSSLSSLSVLQTLVLSSNALAGEIQPAISQLSSLQTLDLSRNKLTGSIPVSLSSLINLRQLDLSYNKLSGELPLSLPPNIITLALRGNLLSGPLRRRTFMPLRYLEVVEMAANNFQGVLDGWFLLMPSLQQVDFANNSLSKINLWRAASSGGGGGRLVAVDFGFNRIDGELPAELSKFPALAALSLRHNKLKGIIPWQYYAAKAGVQFRRLYLDGNFLSGNAPEKLIRGEITGSLGDNCLEKCPTTAPLCSPVQKPNWLCKQAYGSGAAYTNRREQQTRRPRTA